MSSSPYDPEGKLHAAYQRQPSQDRGAAEHEGEEDGENSGLESDTRTLLAKEERQQLQYRAIVLGFALGLATGIAGSILHFQPELAKLNHERTVQQRLMLRCEQRCEQRLQENEGDREPENHEVY